eukprot:365906-Chlamydomonas_euryale.AAC.5
MVGMVLLWQTKTYEVLPVPQAWISRSMDQPEECSSCQISLFNVSSGRAAVEAVFESGHVIILSSVHMRHFLESNCAVRVQGNCTIHSGS